MRGRSKCLCMNSVPHFFEDKEKQKQETACEHLVAPFRIVHTDLKGTNI